MTGQLAALFTSHPLRILAMMTVVLCLTPSRCISTDTLGHLAFILSPPDAMNQNQRTLSSNDDLLVRPKFKPQPFSHWNVRVFSTYLTFNSYTHYNLLT
ncbi:hypothetical protein F5880DRAFT_1557292 [Lentinula raphanica]|nr:hypothetical protein F5880DRAFT_1557292 [Lentinula raphanica]